MDNVIGRVFPVNKNKIDEYKWKIISGYDYTRGRYIARKAYRSYDIDNDFFVVKPDEKTYTVPEAVDYMAEEIDHLNRFEDLLNKALVPSNVQYERELDKLLNSYINTLNLVHVFRNEREENKTFSMNAKRGLRGVEKRMFHYFLDNTEIVKEELIEFVKKYMNSGNRIFTMSEVLSEIEVQRQLYSEAIDHLNYMYEKIKGNS